MKHTSQGLTSRKVAESLEVSFGTVENHRSNISNKFSLKGSNNLIEFAISSRVKS